MNWLTRLTKGLSKTSAALGNGITQIFSHKKPDAVSLDELEDLLIMADLGVDLASQLRQEIAAQKFTKGDHAEQIRQYLVSRIAGVLQPYSQPLLLQHKPQVILVCGVNGNGKTTTIGKLAHQWRQAGKSVMFAACDTFRAAAVEQLHIWAERTQSQFVSGAAESDPASVAYTALERAKQQNIDVLLIDTAGRLHNKANLMEELAKIIRVLKKIDQDVPHNIVLILDATTGQNALSQTETFSKIVGLSGLIVTKLDGSAKAGVVVALANRYKLPIHCIGVGEQIEDLQPFSAHEFAEALLK